MRCLRCFSWGEPLDFDEPEITAANPYASLGSAGPAVDVNGNHVELELEEIVDSPDSPNHAHELLLFM